MNGPQNDSLAGQTQPPAPPTPEDAGSQALSDALRSSFAIVKIIMAGLVVAFLASGIFTVGSQERAVILRLGKPVVAKEGPLLGPGLHWAYPYPIDEVVKITNAQIQTVTSTVGWYATTPEWEAAGTEPPPGVSLNPAVDGYTLTADGNIIHVRANLRYRISDPLAYVFNFTNAAAVVQNDLNNAILYASAHYTVDNALQRDVAGFKEKVSRRVSQLVDEQRLGITLEPIDIRAMPPRQVTNEFTKVLAAEQERSKMINEAQAYASTNLSSAKGEAEARINDGLTSSNRMVQAVAAEAQRFSRLLPEYRKNPDLFRQRLHTETLQRVLANASEKWSFPQPANGQSDEIRLQLSREPPKAKGQAEER